MMLGGVICGYCATGRFTTATAPARVMTSDSTDAKIGRSIKKCENMVAFEEGPPARAGASARRGRGAGTRFLLLLVCRFPRPLLRRLVGVLPRVARPQQPHQRGVGRGRRRLRLDLDRGALAHALHAAD